MNRRRFIKQIGAGAALLNLAPLERSSQRRNCKISILHTNDLHSRIEAFTYGRNKGSGGMLQLVIAKTNSSKRKIFCFWMQEIFFKELLILTIMVVKLSLNS